MTKRKRLKLIKERYLRFLANINYDEDKDRNPKDYHPGHPDNK